MGDTNRAGLAYIKESEWGTKPAGALNDINYTDESLVFNIDNIASNTIRPDRQTANLIQTGADCSGGFGNELQYGGHDEFLLGALFAASWVGVGGGTTEVITSGASGSNLEFDLNATGNTITFGSGVTHGILKGHWFELEGSAGDDGYHQATAVAGQVITVASITTTETLDETDAAEIRGANARNGTTEHSFYIERSHNDVTQFFQFAGCVVNTYMTDAGANAIMTNAFDFIGKNGTRSGATTGTGSNNAAATTDMMNTVTNVGDLILNGTAAAAGLINRIGMELKNNVRGKTAIGVLGYSDISVGEIEITGSLDLHFIDGTYYDLYLAGTAFGLSWRVTDAAGNSYIYTLPSCKFVSDPINIPGKNQDVMEAASYQAIMDATDLYTIQITKIPAA